MASFGSTNNNTNTKKSGCNECGKRVRDYIKKIKPCSVDTIINVERRYCNTCNCCNECHGGGWCPSKKCTENGNLPIAGKIYIYTEAVFRNGKLSMYQPKPNMTDTNVSHGGHEWYLGKEKESINFWLRK